MVDKAIDRGHIKDARGKSVTLLDPYALSLLRRHGKGNRQRIVPLPIEARRALSEYLQSRPPTESQAVFIGERRPLTADGVRAIRAKHSAITGVGFTPHTLRHSFAHRFLEQTENDPVALA